MRPALAYPDRRTRAAAALIAVALICSMAPGWAPAVVPVALILALLLLFRRGHGLRLQARGRTAAADDPLLPRLAQKEADESVEQAQSAALGSAFRRERLERTEEAVDAIVDSCVKLIVRETGAHTVAIFFPMADDGFRMRRFLSNSNHVRADAVIRPGQGVLGSFFKDGLKTLNLREIMNDSTTLSYYSMDAGVRSLIACPLIAGEAERGVIVADSTEKDDFSDDDLSYTATVSALLGQAVYHAYLANEHAVEHQRLAAVSGIEKSFFKNLNLDAILDILAEIIPFALPEECDRLTISMRADDGENASIRRTWGDAAHGLHNKRFPIAGKSLAGILYTKNIFFSRNFALDRYEVRYFDKEPRPDGFGSFCALPLGADDCKGMILVESRRRDVFTDATRELLTRIAMSAGLAIEKFLILEKANALATHDGLTGLCNHRQFQQVLKDEILRSGRYGDPLSLVLCDIDLFKKVNDTHGHVFGDAVLREMGRLLEASIRQSIDTAARYGGEEFALVLVKTSEEQAIETADRIRAAVERMVLRTPAGTAVSVSMSFGIAVFGKHARELSDLIKKADKALYRAKEHGRNRVEVF